METDLSSTDVALVEQIKKGNTNAFDRMFEKYSKSLYLFSLSFIKNSNDAEEIVQEVFFRVWKSRKELNERKSFQSFMFTIAYNLIVDKIRLRTRDREYEKYMLLQAQKNYNVPELELEYKELKQELKKVIDALPEKRKQIYILSKVEGLSHKEIASKMNIKPKTVENHLNLALKQIRNKLNNNSLLTLLFLALFV